MLLTPKKQINILIHVILISCFLNTFFFTYGAHIEKFSLDSQIKYIVDNIFSEVKEFVPLKKEYFSRPSVPDSVLEEDTKAEASNKKIFDTAVKYTFMFVIVCCYIVYKIASGNNVSENILLELLKENLIILIFFGLTEFTFAHFFASQYRSGDPNKVKLYVLKSL
jgi:hypothetical protein